MGALNFGAKISDRRVMGALNFGAKISDELSGFGAKISDDEHDSSRDTAPSRRGGVLGSKELSELAQVRRLEG